MNPFGTIWQSVIDVYDNLFPMVGMNLLWLLLSVPLVAIGALVLVVLGIEPTWAGIVAMLVVILAPSPASVGIHNYARHLAIDERVDFELFWSGLRTFWKPSLALFAIAIGMLALLAINLMFYLNNDSLLRFVAILWFYGIILWFLMLLNMNALLVEQENKSIKLILRNSLVLALDNAIPGLVILIVLTVISLLSIGITLLVALLAGSFVAAVETRAVHGYLERYRARTSRSAS